MENRLVGTHHFIVSSSDYAFQKTFVQSNETLSKFVFDHRTIRSDFDFIILFLVYNLAEEYASSEDYEQALT